MIVKTSRTFVPALIVTPWPGQGQRRSAAHAGAPHLPRQRGLPLQGGAGPPRQPGPRRQVANSVC